MEILLYVSFGFLVLYVLLMMIPRHLYMWERYLAGFFYYGFCISFLVVIYLWKRSVWICLIAIPILFIVQYPLQIIAGAVARAIMPSKKRE
jgi:hypothetical protein